MIYCDNEYEKIKSFQNLYKKMKLFEVNLSLRWNIIEKLLKTTDVLFEVFLFTV